MRRRPPDSPRTYPLFPYSTHYRSAEIGPAAAGAVGHALAEPVVGRALLWVLKHLIGFVDRLEAGLADLAPRIAVGMILHRQLAIGRLQHLVVGGAVDFQQLARNSVVEGKRGSGRVSFGGQRYI